MKIKYLFKRRQFIQHPQNEYKHDLFMRILNDQRVQLHHRLSVSECEVHEAIEAEELALLHQVSD